MAQAPDKVWDRAAAERHDISVLHDDRDFDVIAEITGQAGRVATRNCRLS